MNACQKRIDKAVMSIWHAKPIWSLNLNFDDGEVERLDSIENEVVSKIAFSENHEESKTIKDPVGGLNEILENALISMWNSKSIWSLNLNFDNGEVDKLHKSVSIEDINDDVK